MRKANQRVHMHALVELRGLLHGRLELVVDELLDATADPRVARRAAAGQLHPVDAGAHLLANCGDDFLAPVLGHVNSAPSASHISPSLPSAQGYRRLALGGRHDRRLDRNEPSRPPATRTLTPRTNQPQESRSPRNTTATDPRHQGPALPTPRRTDAASLRQWVKTAGIVGNRPEPLPADPHGYRHSAFR